MRGNSNWRWVLFLLLTIDGPSFVKIGGGLTAAAGLLAGGYLAYKHHEKSEEQVWWSHRIKPIDIID